jgi:hypothetical protein
MPVKDKRILLKDRRMQLTDFKQTVFVLEEHIYWFAMFN